MEQQQPTPDELYIEAEIARAEDEDRNITDVAARMIASQFHGGQASALYSFVSSGAINLEPLVDEYCEVYIDVDTTEAEKRKLRHLGRYILDYGRRDPVEGWSQLWGGGGD